VPKSKPTVEGLAGGNVKGCVEEMYFKCEKGLRVTSGIVKGIPNSVHIHRREIHKYSVILEQTTIPELNVRSERDGKEGKQRLEVRHDGRVSCSI